MKALLFGSLSLLVLETAAAAGAEPQVRSDPHRHLAVRAVPTASAALVPDLGNEGAVPAWKPLGPYGGTVTAVAASPTVPGLVLAALSAGGGETLYRSTDGGQSWLPVPGFGFFVEEIVFAADGTAYLATSFHLRRSTDGGVSWTSLPNPFATSVTEVAIDPASGDLWLGLGTFFGGSTFVIRSTDGGATWSDRSPPLPSPLDATALAFAPGSPLTVYAGFSGFPGGGAVWVSTDGGASWADRSAGLPARPIHELAWDGSRAIVAGGAEFGSQTFGLYASDDGGASWDPQHDVTWPSLYTFGLDLDPNDPSVLLVATARAGIQRSDDGGASWSFGVAGTAGTTFNAVRFAPGSSTDAFAGAGSLGVFRSADGGAGFAPSTDGIRGVEVTSVAVHPDDPDELAAAFSGLNDGGVQLSADGGATWALEPVPPTRYSRVEYSPDGTLYAISDGPSSVAPEGVYRREGDGSWTPLGPDQGGFFETEGQVLRFGTADPGLILLAGKDFGVAGNEATVWRSLTAGAGWTKVYESADPGVVPAVEIVADGSGQEMVAALQRFEIGGGALRSVDGGSFWFESSAGLPADVQATDLCASPADPLRLYLATGFASTDLFDTPDAGASWGSSGPLAADLRAVACDGDLDGVLYAARVFPHQILRSPDSGATWELFDAGLGGGAFRQLVWSPDPARLHLATSSGVWRRDLGVLFADGFESGDLSAWSASTAGP